MEVVNKNVSSKEKMLERIKSLSSSKSNKHEEKEFDHLLASVISIKISLSSADKQENKFYTNIICLEKNTNVIYDNILYKEFDNEIDSSNYYDKLKRLLFSISEEDLYKLINDDINTKNI